MQLTFGHFLDEIGMSHVHTHMVTDILCMHVTLNILCIKLDTSMVLKFRGILYMHILSCDS